MYQARISTKIIYDLYINLYSCINVSSCPCHHRGVYRYTYSWISSLFVFKHNECKINSYLGQKVRTILFVQTTITDCLNMFNAKPR